MSLHGGDLNAVEQKSSIKKQIQWYRLQTITKIGAMGRIGRKKRRSPVGSICYKFKKNSSIGRKLSNKYIAIL